MEVSPFRKKIIGKQASQGFTRSHDGHGKPSQLVGRKAQIVYLPRDRIAYNQQIQNCQQFREHLKHGKFYGIPYSP